MTEPRLLPCLNCRRPVRPKPGKDPTCSPACEAHLGGTVAWLAMLLTRKGPRESHGGP
jgi:hypothetical protein